MMDAMMATGKSIMNTRPEKGKQPLHFKRAFVNQGLSLCNEFRGDIQPVCTGSPEPGRPPTCPAPCRPI